MFLLDENLPPRAGDLLAEMGFPVCRIGGAEVPPRAATDPDIASWCGANGVVWVTVDRGLRKDRAIFDAVVAAGTSVFLLPPRG
jgi:predicted nuclease of predicted toxin-antitoxin system